MHKTATISRGRRRRETERMNPLKSPHALLLLAGLFSIDAHAGAVSPDLHSGMRGGDERAVRSSDGGASRPDGIDCMSSPERCVHKAAWCQDRDNSMSPVSPEEGVGAAKRRRPWRDSIRATKNGRSRQEGSRRRSASSVVVTLAKIASSASVIRWAVRYVELGADVFQIDTAPPERRHLRQARRILRFGERHLTSMPEIDTIISY